MTFDITKKRAHTTGAIELKEADGSPMLDGDGNALSVTVHGPASKVWQVANAAKSRKQAERMRKNGGKVEAVLDNSRADNIDFLTAITVSFDGWEYPCDSKVPADMFRAAYSDDELGFILDHVFAEANDWAAFMNGSAKS